MTDQLAAGALDPRRQAGPVLAAAADGRRKVVHTVLDVDAVSPDLVASVHGAGSDIISIRVLKATAPAAIMAAIRAAADVTAVGVRLDDAPDAALVERCHAHGASYVAGGPLRAILRRPGADRAATIAGYRQIGSYAATADGLRVVIEVSAPDVIAPPEVLLTCLLADFTLTAATGAPTIVVSCPTLGNLIQDVATLTVARRLASELSAEVGVSPKLLISASHWTGMPDPKATNRYASASASTIAAALADSDQVLVGTLGTLTGRTDSTTVDSVGTTRQMLDMLIDQHLGSSMALDTEIAKIENAVRSDLGLIRGSNAGSLVTAVEQAASCSLFIPGLDADPATAAVRDELGSVRSATADTPGSWPVWSTSPTAPTAS